MMTDAEIRLHLIKMLWERPPVAPTFVLDAGELLFRWVKGETAKDIFPDWPPDKDKTPA